MKNHLTLILFLIVVSAFGQEKGIFTLDSCLHSAVLNYPDYRQLSMNNDVTDLNIKNIKTNYYPTLNLNGQASYQSDVTKVPVPPLPGFDMPAIPNDWYKLNLDIEEMIYDGGITSGQKKVELARQNVNDQKVRIELYQLKTRIYTLFFRIIFMKNNLSILKVLHKDLESRIKDAEVSLQNGMLLSADVDALKVEFYNIEQQIIGIQENMEASLQSLKEQTGLNIQSADNLILPEITIDNYPFENNRPEYILLKKQQEQVISLKNLSSSKRRPVFKAFGQAGYGRPGYDMLNPDFDDYYMVGLRLHWNIWDWGKVKREKQVFDLQNNIIKTTKETFDQNLRSELYQYIADIEKYKKIIGTDETIVKLQQNVVKTADSQLKNGTITSTNYLIEVNKLLKANLSLEAHKLQLIFSKYQYLTAIGNL